MMIRTDNQFELAVEPESNIVCFRFVSPGQTDTTLNQINATIRERIVKEGSFYIVQAELDGKIWIRLTIINPVTSENELNSLLKRITEIGVQEII
jgi:L-2,4-diaminobutyrate decarboxylase